MYNAPHGENLLMYNAPQTVSHEDALPDARWWQLSCLFMDSRACNAWRYSGLFMHPQVSRRVFCAGAPGKVVFDTHSTNSSFSGASEPVLNSDVLAPAYLKVLKRWFGLARL